MSQQQNGKTPLPGTETFIVLHEVMGVDLSNIHPYLKVAAGLFTSAAALFGAKFQQCWYEKETGFLVCEWRARDCDSIRKVLSAAHIPYSTIHAMVKYSPDELEAMLPED